MIGKLRDEGKTIILSTHQMDKVEELCNRVLMINRGQAVLYGKLEEIRTGFSKNSVLLTVEGETGDLPGVLHKKLHSGFVELVLTPETTPQIILDQLRTSGVTIKRFEVATPSLNDIFLDIAGGSHE